MRKTTNSGSSWILISSNLPAIGVNSIVVKMSSPRTIFAGTDLGVYKSTNEGASWASFNTGFPNVEVYDLKYKEGPKVLLAATHGRGCFMYDFKNTISNLTLTMKHQAYANTDTISVELRSSTSPYNLVESVKGLGGQSIARIIPFATPINGIPYYIVVKHRNSIETWSGGTNTFSSNALSYNFTTAASQAFGNNLVNVGGVWSIYGGDVNQDGNIGAVDLSLTDNDALNFVSGYVNSDVTGDGTVDAADLSVVDNNAFNFVSRIRP